ncbi:MAG: rod shape-determining protein MreC [Nostocaceae cyanobacterium]|nr:rod shape-determining protein MreC [Nostocaceae cyanobacterium]
MFTIREGWERKGLQIGLLALLIGGAWTIRQTQGALVLEIYQQVTRPLQAFQSKPVNLEELRDARMLELETRIVELENQNQKLKKLVGYVEKQSSSSQGIVARVIGRGADNWWQLVTLNRGSRSGIKEGFVVKGEGGLVGLVQSVTPSTSRVLLITDLKSKVGVNISRTGTKGVLRGDSSAEAVMEFYEKVPNVKLGDLVATSTYSQKYPAGLAIGKVKSLDLKKLPASVATIELLTPIGSLDWVTVHPKPENQLDKKSK